MQLGSALINQELNTVLDILAVLVLCVFLLNLQLFTLVSLYLSKVHLVALM